MFFTKNTSTSECNCIVLGSYENVPYWNFTNIYSPFYSIIMKKRMYYGLLLTILFGISALFCALVTIDIITSSDFLESDWFHLTVGKNAFVLTMTFSFCFAFASVCCYYLIYKDSKAFLAKLESNKIRDIPTIRNNNWEEASEKFSTYIDKYGWVEFERVMRKYEDYYWPVALLYIHPCEKIRNTKHFQDIQQLFITLYT